MNLSVWMIVRNTLKRIICRPLIGYIKTCIGTTDQWPWPLVIPYNASGNHNVLSLCGLAGFYSTDCFWHVHPYIPVTNNGIFLIQTMTSSFTDLVWKRLNKTHNSENIHTLSWTNIFTPQKRTLLIIYKLQQSFIMQINLASISVFIKVIEE